MATRPMITLSEYLDWLFLRRGIDASVVKRADIVKMDRATVSKLARGHMPFTQKRADDFAKALALKGDNVEEIATKILSLSQLATPKMTVNQFFDEVAKEGGAVPAGRVTELLKALTDSSQFPLFCIEYRDLPRINTGSKYSDVAGIMGRAVSEGLSLAMFMPFGIPDTSYKGQTPAKTTLDYMTNVRDECRDLYRTLLEDASAAAGEEAKEYQNRGHVRLYERRSNSSYRGSGLGAKFGYVQYYTRESGVDVVNREMLQWISTPAQDLLVHRGRDQIPPDAVRDSLYPVPHYFDLKARSGEVRPALPGKEPGNAYIDPAVFSSVHSVWSQRHIPTNPKLDYWEIYEV